MTKSQELAQQQEQVENIILQASQQFQHIAKAHNLVNWETESQFALQAIQRNPKLQECAPGTVIDAIINVAAVGLSLSPADGYAYLVPEYNKNNKRQEAQLRVSFKGLIKVANDSGVLEWVRADVVKEQDTFEHHGINQIPIHHFNPFGERGQTIGAYCVAKLGSGDFLVDTMNKAEIEKIQQSAKTDSVWKKWPDEMAKKAIIKRASKQWPKGDRTSRLHETIAVMNQTEGSDFEQTARVESIAADIHDQIADDNKLAVGELWANTTDDEKKVLWVAVTKGGYFTQAQKTYIRGSIKEYYEVQNAIEGEAEIVTDEGEAA